MPDTHFAGYRQNKLVRSFISAFCLGPSPTHLAYLAYLHLNHSPCLGQGRPKNHGPVDHEERLGATGTRTERGEKSSGLRFNWVPLLTRGGGRGGKIDASTKAKGRGRRVVESGQYQGPRSQRVHTLHWRQTYSFARSRIFGNMQPLSYFISFPFSLFKLMCGLSVYVTTYVS